MDDSLTVGKAVAAEGGELIAFARVKVGEGIDVEEKNFADEVAEAVRST
jgi:elongation factor Ts